ncbi:hypothetical protein WMF18_38550 [Sorangium sp. So ce315]|uniref:hypothetical protein n=1 Tax=Sorangium sp. So ce315 TaxID=3133299 RepID=UPI003F647D5F
MSLGVVLPRWGRFVVGENASILIALDWTDFDKDDHTTLCASMVTTHGRAMPLAWKTVKKSALKDQRTGREPEMVERLHTWLPENVNITLLRISWTEFSCLWRRTTSSRPPGIKSTREMPVELLEQLRTAWPK